MLSHATKNRETHDAIERYVMAAIVDAREVYTDPKWLTWADHWINGRDRSFASARSAHRMARQACDRESVELAAEAQDSPEGVDTEFSLLETGAEMAAWAAGLALVTAPVAPDLTAGIRRNRVRLAQETRRDSRRRRGAVDSSIAGRPSGCACAARRLDGDAVGSSADGAFIVARICGGESSRRDQKPDQKNSLKTVARASRDDYIRTDL